MAYFWAFVSHYCAMLMFCEHNGQSPFKALALALVWPLSCVVALCTFIEERLE